MFIGSMFGGIAANLLAISLMAMNSEYSFSLVPLITGTLVFSPAANVALIDFASTLPSIAGTGLESAALNAVASWFETTSVERPRRQAASTVAQVTPAAASVLLTMVVP